MRVDFRQILKDFHWAMHYYFWYVDDVCITNPHAAISYGCFAAINTFEVPEEGEDFYFVRDVPHGTVSLCKYTSQVNGHIRRAMCILHPDMRAEMEGILYCIYSMGSGRMRPDGYGRVR